MVPSSGTLTWKSDSSSSRKASNSSSALSISSISSTTRRGAVMARSSGRSSRYSREKTCLRDLLPARPCCAIRLDAQELLLVVPLVERLGLVEPFVALQADEVGVQHLGQHLADLGLAGAGRTLDEQRLLERQRQEEHGLDRLGGDVARAAQAVRDGFARELHEARSSARVASV